MCMWGFCVARITTMVQCAKSQDFPVPERMVLDVSHAAQRGFVFTTTGFKVGGKQCHETCDIAALRKGIQQSLRTQLGPDTRVQRFHQ